MVALASMSRPPPDDPDQFKRFQDAANEHGVEVSTTALDRALGKIAPPKPATRGKHPGAWPGKG